MADAVISLIIETLGSTAFQLMKEEVGLVSGVEIEVDKLKTTFEDIQAVLKDAEKKQLIKKEERLSRWLDQLTDVSHDIDNVLDEWVTSILKSKVDEGEGRSGKACFCSTSQADRLRMRRHIAKEIKQLNEKLDGIAKAKDSYNQEKAINDSALGVTDLRKFTTSLIEETKVHGREIEKDNLVSKLVPDENSDESREFNILSIVGVGGIGKTTLAQLAYNDDRVKECFDKRLWVCVSDPFDEIKVAKAILEGLNGSAPNLVQLNTLVESIYESVKRKKFLLVLDDVWTENYERWEELEKSLRNGAGGSRILVTTRNEKVATMMGATTHIAIDKLSEDICWRIFSQRAFLNMTDEERRQLEGIGRLIASKCNGLPLIAKTLGGLMCGRKTTSQWNAVLDSELWQLEVIFAPFLLSYYDLSPLEKRCLLYCSVFPKDYKIKRDQLIQMWMSQGYLGCNSNFEEHGETCFESLARRSFFQDFEKDAFDGSIVSCKMHDIVHSFVRFLTKNEYCVIEEIGGVNNKKMEPLGERTRHLLVECVNEFPTLKYNKNNEKNMRTLLVSPKSSGILGAPISSFLFLYGLRCIRTLSLHGCNLKTLPKNIGKLIHLRYLDLSDNRCLEELPDTICDLYNLQTLRLKGCFLLRLPEGMGKLVNLRHLSFNTSQYLDGLPKFFARLTCLQTLDIDQLVIPKDKEEFFDLGDLKELPHVFRHKRSFMISGCRNVEKVSEAEKIDLMKNMEQLVDLTIDFRFGDQSKEQTRGEDHETKILEALQPHPNLRSLMINNCLGTSLSPEWMMSLTNLTSLELKDCYCFEILPPLGKLPMLDSLVIEGMNRLKKVGPEFLGITTTEEVGKDITTKGYDDSLTKSSSTSFPKLKSLKFSYMEQWESWEGNISTTLDANIVIMPCLQSLELYGCPVLEALPDFLPWNELKHLYMENCDTLEKHYLKEARKELDKISRIPSFYIIEAFKDSETAEVQVS